MTFDSIYARCVQLIAVVESSGAFTADQIQDLRDTFNKDWIEHGDHDFHGPSDITSKVLLHGLMTHQQIKIQGSLGNIIWGNYVLVEYIGKGGEGCVYKARGPSSSVVAIKVLARPDKASMERFARQMRIVRGIADERIVKHVDLLKHEDIPFLVMEWVTAKPVGHCSPIPWEQAVSIVSDIAEVAEILHQNGSLHRDISPNNIFTTTPAKLGDFGIARAVDDKSLSETGIFLGSRKCAAPEQLLDSTRIDCRADIFGLGAVLFYLINGKYMFDVKGEVQSFEHAQRSPRPRLGKGVPTWLDSLFQSMVAADPNSRPQSMREVSTAIRLRAFATAEIEVQLFSTRLLKLSLASLLVVTLASVVFTLAIAYSSRSQTTGQSLSLNSVPQRNQKTNSEGNSHGAAKTQSERSNGVNRWSLMSTDLPPGPFPIRWHPGGVLLAVGSSPVRIYETNPQFRIQSYVSNVEERVNDLSWSHDGNSLAIVTDGGELQIWVSGNSSLVFSNPKSLKSVCWSPSDNELAIIDFQGTLTVLERSGEKISSFHTNQANGNDVCWSADGEHIVPGGVTRELQLFTINGTLKQSTNCRSRAIVSVDWSEQYIATGGYELQIWKPDGTLLRTIPNAGGEDFKIESVQWQTPSKLVYIDRSNQVFVLDGDPVAVAPKKITNSGRYADMRPNGKQIAVSGVNGGIDFWDIDDIQKLARLNSSRSNAHQPRIAITTNSGATVVAIGTQEGDIYFLDSQLTPITCFDAHEGAIYHIGWHPHEPVLASLGEDKSLSIWGLDGNNITQVQGLDGSVSARWHPRGDLLAVPFWTKSPKVELYNANGTLVKSHTLPAYSRCVAWSVDGEHLAVGLYSSKGVALFRSPTETSYELFGAGVLKDVVATVGFGPFSKTLYAGSHEGSLYRFEYDNREPTKLSGHSNQIMWAAWRQGGGIFASRAHNSQQILLWDSNNQPIGKLDHTAIVERAYWAPDGSLLATLSAGKINLWNPDENKLIRSYNPGAIREFAWSHDSTHIYAVGVSDLAYAIDVENQTSPIQNTIWLRGDKIVRFDAEGRPKSSDTELVAGRFLYAIEDEAGNKEYLSLFAYIDRLEQGIANEAVTGEEE